MRRPTLSLLQRALLVSSLGTSAHAAGVPTLQEVAVTARQHELIGVADSAGHGTALSMDLEQAVARLPPRARAVLVLHDVEGWKHEEIAETLDMAVGSSKAQLHRARKLLRAKLGDHA